MRRSAKKFSGKSASSTRKNKRPGSAAPAGGVGPQLRSQRTAARQARRIEWKPTKNFAPAAKGLIDGILREAASIPPVKVQPGEEPLNAEIFPSSRKPS